MTSSASPRRGSGPAPPDPAARFKERVRQWREEAILQAVAELLVEQGCQRLTMDDVAKRVGIAKGSLYLHTNARAHLVAEVLDRWLTQIPGPTRPPHIPDAQRIPVILAALLAPGAHGGPAFPCCLHHSPCPHGWADRWAELARAYGLDEARGGVNSAKDADLLGEAIQALATVPTVRALSREGKLEAAREVVTNFLAAGVAASN